MSLTERTDLIPFILGEEKSRLLEDISGQNLSVIYAGPIYVMVRKPTIMMSYICVFVSLCTFITSV